MGNVAGYRKAWIRAEGYRNKGLLNMNLSQKRQRSWGMLQLGI
ncbi:MAG: hypothetical protein Ct9H300mP3_08340 [Gammaproteobacteria bacterium]|nr:MAG: hypothetical protein Ct9H300mP3_08340 [Gammaproteobacteria bacterium]